MLGLGRCTVHIAGGRNRDAMIHQFHIGMNLFSSLLSRHLQVLDSRIVHVCLELRQLQIQVVFEDAILQLRLLPRWVIFGGEKVGDSLGV